MNNLKLQNKIFLILLLPIVAILILSSNSIFNKYEENVKMNESIEYLYFLENVSSLIHDLQKERSISTLFLESYGKEFATDFRNQTIKSDESINKLEQFLKKYSFFKDEESVKRITDFGNSIKQIVEIRQKNI